MTREQALPQPRPGYASRAGPNHWNYKLTDEQRAEVRRLRLDECLALRVIAARFGVSVALIHTICGETR